jgi:hypothetical protein
MAKLTVTTDAGEVIEVIQGSQLTALRRALEASEMHSGEDVLAFALWVASMEDDHEQRFDEAFDRAWDERADARAFGGL